MPYDKITDPGNFSTDASSHSGSHHHGDTDEMNGHMVSQETENNSGVSLTLFQGTTFYSVKQICTSPFQEHCPQLSLPTAPCFFRFSDHLITATVRPKFPLCDPMEAAQKSTLSVCIISLWLDGGLFQVEYASSLGEEIEDDNLYVQENGLCTELLEDKVVVPRAEDPTKLCLNSWPAEMVT